MNIYNTPLISISLGTGRETVALSDHSANLALNRLSKAASHCPVPTVRKASKQVRRASEEAAALGGLRIELGEPWSQLGGPQSQLVGSQSQL